MGWNNFWSSISYLYARALSWTWFFFFFILRFFPKKTCRLVILYKGSFFDYIGRVEIHQPLPCLFGKFETSKSHSEINWPVISKWRENWTRIRWRHFFHVSKLAVENSFISNTSFYFVHYSYVFFHSYLKSSTRKMKNLVMYIFAKKYSIFAKKVVFWTNALYYSSMISYLYSWHVMIMGLDYMIEIIKAFNFLFLSSNIEKANYTLFCHYLVVANSK